MVGMAGVCVQNLVTAVQIMQSQCCRRLWTVQAHLQGRSTHERNLQANPCQREEDLPEQMAQIRNRLTEYNAGALNDHVTLHPKRASVLVPLYLDPASNTVMVIFTVRSSQLRSHAGEICFPGGRRDEIDVDSWHTALREAEEEIALNPAHVHCLGELRQVLSMAGHLVTPYVAYVHGELSACYLT